MCNALHNFSFVKDLLVCYLKTWWIFLKISFWLLGDRFSPVQWMTLKQQWAFAPFSKCRSAQASKSWMFYKMFHWKLKTMLSDPHFCIRFHHKAVVSGGRVWTEWLFRTTQTYHRLYWTRTTVYNILLRLNFIEKDL